MEAGINDCRLEIEDIFVLLEKKRKIERVTQNSPYSNCTTTILVRLLGFKLKIYYL